MKIVVLVKQVPDTEEERTLDPVTGRIYRDGVETVIDEISERALEVALRRKDADKATEVVLLSMGPDSATEALRKGLSMGADSAVHVLDDSLAGSDAVRTALVLAAALRRIAPDLTVAGNESTDGRGGVVPAMLAEHLGVPQLTFLHAVEISDGSVQGERATEGGTLTAHTALPAVISVTERSAEARFPSFKGIMTAKKKPLEVLSLGDLGIELQDAAGGTEILSVAERPARVAGKKIIDEGNAGVELAEFLSVNRLI